MHTPLPLTRDLVLVGGGHAHALILRMWGMRKLPGVQVTLINPGPTAPYSGMLPGHIAGHYSREALDIDLVRLARFAGARLILGEAVGIDLQARTIEVAGRGPVGYDVASLDIGIHAEMPAIEGFREHATGAKPLDTYAARWREFLARAAAGDVAPEVAVIGGGVAGVELALAMAHALRRDLGKARVSVIEAGAQITARTPGASRKLAHALADHGVAVRLNSEVERIEAGAVRLTDGTEIPAALTIGAAGAFAHGWLRETQLPLSEDGSIRVGADLRVEGHDTLFAVGDCAHMSHDPRPKAGVFAVRAGPVLLRNLQAVLSGSAPRPFRPQRDYLKLISLGDKNALAEKWGLSLSGPLLWRWKNRIDERFMERFRQLPAMPEPPLPARLAEGVKTELGGKPLCGGCGAKVGPGALSAALAALGQPKRADVLTGPGDDAALLRIGGAQQVITTDHLRGFIADHGLMARIAAVHALGDIWAMGAAAQAALVSVILPRMSQELQARAMEEILRAAQATFSAEGCEIVGGHSSMGAELTIGYTLTGLAPERPIGKDGAKAGDAIVLTRPLGAGLMLAAEMRGQAPGGDIARLYEAMARPQGDAARLLAGARAMSDVTGFGLAGHLLEICKASGVSAELVLDAIPAYPGALALAEAGHRSSLHGANEAAAPVSGVVKASEAALAALLHDPQTAGGLLAALDPQEAFGLAMDLRKAGHEAAVIGTFREGPPAIALSRNV